MKNRQEQNTQTVSILITDDHKLVRDGLKLMLASVNKFMKFAVAEAGSGEEALRKVSQQQTDIIVLDYQMPGISGADTIYRILRFNPGLKILVLSNYDELAYIQMVMDAGAKGYILKNVEPAELLKAIRTVLEGKIYYSNEVAIKLIDAAAAAEVLKTIPPHLLSSRETEVLRLIAMEFTNDEIAQKIFVSKRTVDAHRQHLIQKLHVKNTAGLVKAAYKLNLISCCFAPVLYTTV